MTSALVQGAVIQSAVPWTPSQIHDTVAKIAAKPIYDTGARGSLVGRFLTFLWDRFTALLSLFHGTLNPWVMLTVAATIVIAVIVAQTVVARRLDEGALRAGRGRRAGLGGRVDYWVVARDEAAAGRYAEASHAVYAAVIDSLATDGAMNFHTSKTSGDYARDLRRTGSPVLADFRAFSRLFDRAIYGETHIGADDYARLRESAERAARGRAPA